MSQGNDEVTGELLPAFDLPVNGSTTLQTSAAGAVVDLPATTVGGFYEFSTSADCFIALGSLLATIPIVGTPGGLPLLAGVAKVYAVPAGTIVSAIGAAAFNLHMSKV